VNERLIAFSYLRIFQTMTNKLSEKLFQENNLTMSDSVVRRVVYSEREISQGATISFVAVKFCSRSATDSSHAKLQWEETHYLIKPNCQLSGV
jgi:hypothetical protein